MPLGEKYESKSLFPGGKYFWPILKTLLFLELDMGAELFKVSFPFFLVIVSSSRLKVLSSVVKYLCGKRHTTAGYPASECPVIL